MHPLAVMGILAVIGGIVLIVVTLMQLSGFLGLVLAGNLPPLLLFVAGLALSLRRMRAGKDAAPLLMGSFIGAMVLWVLLNVRP